MRVLISALTLCLLILPEIIFAQGGAAPVKTLINLPVTIQPGEDGFSGYINLLYALSISVAGLLVVIKIIIAGAKYMLSDVVTTKGDAIKEIRGALLGLLLILAAVLILTVINPQLKNATLKFDPQPMPNVSVTPPVTSANGGEAARNAVGNILAPTFYSKNITEYGDITQSAVQRNGNVFTYDVNAICGSLSGTEKQDCISEQADNFGDFCEQNLSQGYATDGRDGRYSGTPSQSISCRLPTSWVWQETIENNSPAGGDWEDTCESWEESPILPVTTSVFGTSNKDFQVG